MDTKIERAVRTEKLFRNVNEAIAETSDAGRLLLVCECDNSTCTNRLQIPVGEYDEIRENRRLFLVEPGHEDLQVERVVDRRAAYTVVEKPAN